MDNNCVTELSRRIIEAEFNQRKLPPQLFIQADCELGSIPFFGRPDGLERTELGFVLTLNDLVIVAFFLLSLPL
jgi:hypothetical protein